MAPLGILKARYDALSVHRDFVRLESLAGAPFTR